MSKLSARQEMKRLLIANKAMDIESIAKQAGSHEPSIGISTMAASAGTLTLIARTPASLFRCDKPDLDQRRVKRYASKGRVLKAWSLPTGAAV